MLFKYIFRYAVIGTVGYAIIASSAINVYGLIGGFFLSVLALLIEAVYEMIYFLRHGS